MKIRDRDLNKIKIDNYLNDFVWSRGIKNPPHKIKVKATKEGEIVRVELADFPEKLKFKKLREEKREQKAKDIGAKKKDLLEKTKEEKPVEEKTEQEKKDEKEKQESSIESMKQLEKAAAKSAKHQAGGKTKEPKHLQRFALEK